jgi:hypothetical protein
MRREDAPVVAQLRILPLILLMAVAGCETPDRGAGDALDVAVTVKDEEDEEPDDDAPDPADYSLRAGQLFPMKPGRVYWYAATTRPRNAPEQTREIAIVSMWDRDAGTHLETVGLGEPETALRFVIGQRARNANTLYVLPGGFGEGAYSMTVLGQREELRRVHVVDRTWETIIFEHREGSSRMRHWLAPNQGLVRYDVEIEGEVVFSLELVDELRQGTPREGYSCSTPDEFWRSYRAALKRLDVQGLQRLLAPALRRRLARPARDGDLGLDKTLLRKARVSPRPSDILQERIRSMMPDLLGVELRPTGSWSLKKGAERELATAPAELVAWVDGKRKTGDAELVLSRGPKGEWQLETFRPKPE